MSSMSTKKLISSHGLSTTCISKIIFFRDNIFFRNFLKPLERTLNVDEAGIKMVDKSFKPIFSKLYFSQFV